MTIPFWCLLFACLVPYVYPAFTFKARAELEGGVDNNHPRSQQAALPAGPAARAVGAMNNAFEALPIFASAVIVNHLAGGDPTQAAGLSIAWVVLRLAHGFFYIQGISPARSASFALALLCAVGLFVTGAMGGGAG